jgi:hypothetical protein
MSRRQPSTDLCPARAAPETQFGGALPRTSIITRRWRPPSLHPMDPAANRTSRASAWSGGISSPLHTVMVLWPGMGAEAQLLIISGSRSMSTCWLPRVQREPSSPTSHTPLPHPLVDLPHQGRLAVLFGILPRSSTSSSSAAVPR